MNKNVAVLLKCSLLLALTGCSLSKPYPAKQLYTMNVTPPSGPASSNSGQALRVLAAQVATPFSNREFHYLVAPNQFQQDYYANFVADPDRLITNQLVKWMSETGMYAVVVDASSTVNTDRSLQCVVSELYGDMSDAAAPKAVVAARFFLLDDSGVDATVLFTRDYREVEPVRGGGADNLSLAWDRATHVMFQHLTTDLSAVRDAAHAN